MADPHWSCTPVVRIQLSSVLSFACGQGIVEETALVALAEEIARYLVFRRTGLCDATRLDWISASDSR